MPQQQDITVGIGFKQPFQAQLDFFRAKLNLPTERWDDIMRSAHDRAFIVAGAAKADLLQDLRQAVDDVIAKGGSIGAFRKDFAAIVARHGWTGWTGGRTGRIGCTGWTGWIGSTGRIGWIGRIGPRQRSLAISTAACASTSPATVATSKPGPAAAPLLAGLQVPAVTSIADRRMMSRTSAGVSRAQACLISAATPASCGAAAEVPLIAAQPSSAAVSSLFGCVPPAKPVSMLHPGCSGSMM